MASSVWTTTLTIVLIATLVAVNAPALPDPLAGDPIVNGDFELHAPEGAGGLLEDTPVDECIGVGHQVFYGSGTWQKRAEDAALAAAEGDLEGAEENAQGAADAWTEDPVHEVEFFSGYGHCVANNEQGVDLVWFNAVNNLERPAVHWSHLDENTQFGDHDDDGDREARIGADPSAASHNLWQAYPSPFQAYTGNFDAFAFRLESGTAANVDPSEGASGIVRISLSATPMETLTPWVLLWLECDLTFTTQQIHESAQPVDGETGVHQVTLDPTQGILRSRDPACDEAKAQWDDAAPGSDERREILGRLRLVQVSFWSFNRGPGPVVLDDVGILGASTFLEEAAAGNLNAPEL